MESGLAASKKGLLKKQCPFTGCRAGDAGGGFYSMPSEGPAGTKRHFQSLRTPRLCRGTWLKKPPDVRRKRLRPPAPGKAVCGQRLSGTKALLPERPIPPLFSGRRQAEAFCGPRRVPAMRPFRACARRTLCPAPVPRHCARRRPKKPFGLRTVHLPPANAYRGLLFRTGHSPLLQPRAGSGGSYTAPGCPARALLR